ncbi:hypothetical protein HPULCUR_001256 [Helicostylum pulchrum]|uniref:Uncharacterized protein n=1 Tax=Helicostylum pulchrum TaxID=562976 RepID=A0ABP9XP87_9FUNG
MSDKKKSKQPALSCFFSSKSSSNTSNDIISSSSSPITVSVREVNPATFLLNVESTSISSDIAPNESLASSVPAIDLSSATPSSTEESLFVPIDEDEEADSDPIDDHAFHDANSILGSPNESGDLFFPQLSPGLG